MIKERRWQTLWAGILVAICRLAMTILPSRKAGLLLGRPVKQHQCDGEKASVESATPIVRRVKRAAKRLPFSTTCLQQAIVCRYLLSRAGIRSTVCLGVLRDRSLRENCNDVAKAHAWLECNGIIVQGKEEMHRYVFVGAFHRTADCDQRSENRLGSTVD